MKVSEISSEIDSLIKERGGCPIFHVINEFKGADREAIVRLVDSNVITTHVVRYLATKGFEVNPHKLWKHRRRLKGSGCSCPVDL